MGALKIIIHLEAGGRLCWSGIRRIRPTLGLVPSSFLTLFSVRLINAIVVPAHGYLATSLDVLSIPLLPAALNSQTDPSLVENRTRMDT